MATDKPKPPRTPEQELARRSRRAFIALGAGAVGAYAGWRWINSAELDNEIPWPLRRVLDANEVVLRKTLYSNSNLVQTFPASAIRKIKVNGDIGMEMPIDPRDWHLEVTPMGGSVRVLTLADITALPRYEEIIDFKCVEGWSTVTQFAGARLSDFIARFSPGSEKAAFVGMNTPSKDYYVGLDMPSALHPQTLLAYEMNGAPLTDKHGAPLRLVMPVKYGIKNIKRIGRIWYANERPADYWAEQGYDYYSGL
ncbi:MAG TPA: molybdopterin-dependent oxidoreductase [Bryobacteraceae bacterium]|nr:molybdopterin-dependent oxidoreductase [Bryobacteraceae bacterium]